MSKKNQEKRALSMIADEIQSFEIENLSGEKETLYLYPLQLGRLAMISSRLIDLDASFEGDEGDVKRMWDICSKKPHIVAEIIAIATLRTKAEIDTQLKERTNLILHSPSMTPTGMVNVFMNVIFQSFHADFMTAIRSVRTFRVTISQSDETERIANTEGGASGER